MPSSSMTGNHPKLPMLERPTVRFALRFALAMGAGALIAYLAKRSGYLASLGDLGWLPGDVMALILAAVLLGTAVVCAVAGSDPRVYRRVAARDAAADDPIDPQEVANARRQAIVLATAAMALAVPPLAMVLGAPVWVRHVGVAAIALLLAVETFFNWKLWRHGDELTRRVIVETGALTFWALQMALFVFAALARMALVPDLSSWAMLQILLAVYLAVSAVVGVRRGLANP